MRTGLSRAVYNNKIFTHNVIIIIPQSSAGAHCQSAEYTITRGTMLATRTKTMTNTVKMIPVTMATLLSVRAEREALCALR